MRVDLMNRAFHSILLKIEQSFPDIRVDNCGLFEEGCVGFLPQDETFEDVKKCFEIDEVRRVIDIELFKISQYFIFDIRNKCFIVPDFIKPRSEISAITVAIDDKIQLDVGGG